MERKRMKSEENEDRLSDLPDSLIQHILSLLPSTKQAVQTSFLSKRWRNQWTQVPALFFDSTGMSCDNFLKFIDNVLIRHDCSKIRKFHLYRSQGRKDLQFSSKIRFATLLAVEDLQLSFLRAYVLPEFLFNNASLVKLTTTNCAFMPDGKVNWECMTTLIMSCCCLPDRAMELILSGSPLLETISLSSCSFSKKLVIASNSLKVFILEKFRHASDIEISCPNLEQLKFFRSLDVKDVKLLNLPSSLCATIDFNDGDLNEECRIPLIKDILQQLRHVKELTLRGWLMEYLSNTRVGVQFSPMLNMKCLTLYSYKISAIAILLRNSPVLEKLAIDLTQGRLLFMRDDEDCLNAWENLFSDASVFNCVVSHLKTVKIIGFPNRDGRYKIMLKFVQFFLKNSRVLEKMVVKLKDDGTAFPLEVSQELLSLPRCSQYAIIEFK